MTDEEQVTSMAKAEFTLVREPTAADIVALFEQIKGLKATAEERRNVQAEMERGVTRRTWPSGAAEGPGIATRK
jgi:hypothetical protein